MGNGASAELPGLDEACRALAAGRAVVVPNPSPMTYGIVGTDPRVVNALKGRPLDQNVAVSLHDDGEWRQVAGLLDVPAELVPTVRELLRQRLSLLVPVRARAAPAWLAPAVAEGHLAVFNGRWAPAAALWDRFPRLYGSSANRTGQPPAASAETAATQFGPGTPVVDGDAFRELTRPHAASTMVRVAPDGRPSVYRSGAQDAGIDPDEFVRRLRADT